MDLEAVARWPLAMGLLWASSSALAATPTRYLTVINDDDRTVERVEISAAGSAEFKVLPLASPLEGGRAGQATASVPEGACPRDLRVIYRDGTVLMVTAWNVCRQTVLHVGAARLAGQRQRQRHAI